MLRSDNDGEYKFNEFNLFCQNHGIQNSPHPYPSPKWSL
jgi:hypothetical protein